MGENTTPSREKRWAPSEDPYVPFVARPLPNSSSKRRRTAEARIITAEVDKSPRKKKAPLRNNNRSNKKNRRTPRKRAAFHFQTCPISPDIHQPSNMYTDTHAYYNQRDPNFHLSADDMDVTTSQSFVESASVNPSKSYRDENLHYNNIAPPQSQTPLPNNDGKFLRRYIHGKEMIYNSWEKAETAHPFVESSVGNFATASTEVIGRALAKFGLRDIFNILLELDQCVISNVSNNEGCFDEVKRGSNNDESCKNNVLYLIYEIPKQALGAIHGLLHLAFPGIRN